jgi:hypothetical protein
VGEVADPDRQAAIEQIADALGEAFNADVRVRGTSGGFTAQIRFASLDEALTFADQIRASPGA